MKALQNITAQAIITTAILLTVFAPFTALPAQADIPSTDVNDTTRNAPAAGVNISTNNTNNATTIPASSATNYTNNSSVVPTNNLFANCSLNNISGCITAIVYAFTIGLGSIIAYLAANLFDTAVQLSLNSAAYSLDFVSVGWTTARDLANMGFLFVLLYIAFTLIFRAETNNTMSMLAGVIVVALLVNFSFFFSRLAIDAGNILSIEFYNSIPAPPVSQSPVQNIPGVATAISYLGPNANEKDLTASIMNMLQVQNLLNNQSFTASNNSGSIIATIFIYIAGAIILWLLTVTFATNAAKFLFRIVALWLLIIASPLAFIAAGVQGVNKGYFQQWRQLLFQNALYPVAFMFIFLLLTNFANEAAGNGSLLGNVFTQLQQQGNSWGAIIGAVSSIGIRLALVVGVMIAGMKLSDQFSVAGASAAEKFGSWAGGKFIGAYGVAGRYSLGWTGNKIGQSNVMQQWAARDSVIGRNLWRGANKLGGATFDARNTLKSIGVKDAVGLNMKNANKGGYKAAFDARVKSREDEAKKFNPTEAQKEAYDKAVKEAAAQDNANAAAAKMRAERQYAPANATTAKQLADVQAERLKSEQARTEAQVKLDEANKKVKEADDEIKNADKEIQELRDNGKTGTPEMSAAYSRLNAAKTRLGTLSAAAKPLEAEVAKHTANIETFNSNIKKLEDDQKKIAADIAKRAKELTPEKIEVPKADAAKKEYIASITGEGKLGRLGNMSRFGFWIPPADREASAKIRKGKSKKDEVWEELQKSIKEDAEKEEKKEEPAAEKKEDKKDGGH